MNRVSFLIIFASVALASHFVTAAAPTSATFDAAPKQWNPTIGGWTIADGMLVGKELEADHHPAAGRLLFPFKDGTIRGKFRMGDANGINLGFDPVPGELDKKGHLCSMAINGKQASLSLAPNKAKEGDKAVVLAKASVSPSADEWNEFEITCRGQTIEVKLDGAMLAATHAELAAKKNGLILRVSGGTAYFDDIVWDVSE